jgi:hypothetical protein
MSSPSEYPKVKLGAREVQAQLQLYTQLRHTVGLRFPGQHFGSSQVPSVDSKMW